MLGAFLTGNWKFGHGNMVALCKTGIIEPSRRPHPLPLAISAAAAGLLLMENAIVEGIIAQVSPPRGGENFYGSLAPL